jgi:adenylosuccinate synthase
MSDLPQAAREYLNRIEALIGLPIKMISVGPEREQIIIKD